MPLDSPGESIVERACDLASRVVLVGMVVIIAAEVIARLFHYSFEVVDELGGYLFVALTFLSIPVALMGGAIHQVEFVLSKLSRQRRAVFGAAFSLLSLAFCGVMLWQLTRLVLRSRASDVRASTVLDTPLWVPQSLMVIGMAALIIAFTRLLIFQLRTAFEKNVRPDA